MESFTIIGGGIAGLTTAIALNKTGIKANLYEAAGEFRPAGAGIVLAGNAMQVYKKLGLYEELIMLGNPVNQAIIYDQKGKVIVKTKTDDIPGGLTNLAISRTVLHNFLLSKLDKEYLHTGKRSKDFMDNGDHFQVIFNDGSLIESKYLIIAEGIHSAIRKQLLPDSEVRYAGYTCWRGLVDNSELNITATSETWGRYGRFGIVPLGNGKLYWFATKNSDRDDPDMKNYKTAELLENFRDYHKPIRDVIIHTQEENIIWNDIMDLKPIDRYAFDNLVLIGDAAHATTPNMGQGACQAIEDAYILSGCLMKNSQVSEAFRTFQDVRIKRTHEVVNRSWTFGKIAQWEYPLAARSRNIFFRNLPGSFYKKQQRWLYKIEL